MEKTQVNVAVLQVEMKALKQQVDNNHQETNRRFEHVEEKIDNNHKEIMDRFDESGKDNRGDYAAKWVEQFIKTLIAVILIAVLGALLALVLRQQDQTLNPIATATPAAAVSEPAQSRTTSGTVAAPQQPAPPVQPAPSPSPVPKSCVINLLGLCV